MSICAKILITNFILITFMSKKWKLFCFPLQIGVSSLPQWTGRYGNFFTCSYTPENPAPFQTSRLKRWQPHRFVFHMYYLRHDYFAIIISFAFALLMKSINTFVHKILIKMIKYINARHQHSTRKTSGRLNIETHQ